MKTREWLGHRFGERRLEAGRAEISRKSLELNATSSSFLDTYGKKEFQAFIGFLDLVGFSHRSMGWPPAQIAAYLRPFLGEVIHRLVAKSCLVDKTIGDEVMFILPDTEAEDGMPVNLAVGWVMAEIDQLFDKYGATHPFRLGLAFGTILVDQIGYEGYTEWTTFGEPIHLAKRLHTLEALSEPAAFVGAFGVLLDQPDAAQQYHAALSYLTCCGERWRIGPTYDRHESLKGVSPSRVAVFRTQPGR